MKVWDSRRIRLSLLSACLAMLASGATVSGPSPLTGHNSGAQALARDELLVSKGESAIAEYKKILERDPGNAAAQAGIRDLYLQLNKLDEARAWYQRQTQINPRSAEAYYSIGMIDWKQSNGPRTKLKSELGLELDDPIEPASRREGLCATTRPLIAEGMRLLNRAIQLKPDHGEAMSYLGLLYRVQADCQATPEARNRDREESNQWGRKALAMMKKTGAPLAPPPPPPPPPSKKGG